MQPYSREYWKNLLPVIQAFADGKEVECAISGERYHAIDKPSFNGDFAYRIKPEELFRLNTYEEAAEILKAISEGKSVEVRGYNSSWETSGVEWPMFGTYQYRIKGESK